MGTFRLKIQRMASFADFLKEKGLYHRFINAIVGDGYSYSQCIEWRTRLTPPGFSDAARVKKLTIDLDSMESHTEAESLINGLNWAKAAMTGLNVDGGWLNLKTEYVGWMLRIKAMEYMMNLR
jgi:hypothetical protein